MLAWKPSLAYLTRSVIRSYPSVIIRVSSFFDSNEMLPPTFSTISSLQHCVIYVYVSFKAKVALRLTTAFL